MTSCKILVCIGPTESFFFVGGYHQYINPGPRVARTVCFKVLSNWQSSRIQQMYTLSLVKHNSQYNYNENWRSKVAKDNNIDVVNKVPQ